MLDALFEQFDALIVLDTETTGFSPLYREIIELGFVCRRPDGSVWESDHLIRLSPGKYLPGKITELTGITEDMLRECGLGKEEAAADLLRAMDCERPLIAAYNAQFDLCFLYYYLLRLGRADVLKKAKFLDALTVYRDRQPYPHKLADAVEAYRVEGVNSHRASDDAAATLGLLAAMEAERADLEQYINLFGYLPQFGVPKPQISSVRYKPQPYGAAEPLYMT